MARYALVNTANSTLIDLREYATQPGNPAGKARKWLPCPAVAPPAFDPKTQKLTGPTYTINVSDVTEAWEVLSLTTEELSSAKVAAIAAINGPYRAIMKALLDHENRIRAKEAPPQDAFTMAEYETDLQGKL